MLTFPRRLSPFLFISRILPEAFDSAFGLPLARGASPGSPVPPLLFFFEKRAGASSPPSRVLYLPEAVEDDPSGFSKPPCSFLAAVTGAPVSPTSLQR